MFVNCFYHHSMVLWTKSPLDLALWKYRKKDGSYPQKFNLGVRQEVLDRSRQRRECKEAGLVSMNCVGVSWWEWLWLFGCVPVKYSLCGSLVSWLVLWSTDLGHMEDSTFGTTAALPLHLPAVVILALTFSRNHMCCRWCGRGVQLCSTVAS